MEENKTFPSGAVRSKDADDTRFDLISPIGLRRLAARYALGAKKYDDHNWRKGMPHSDLLNHLMRHANLYNSGDRSDDHLAAVAWGAFALMHFEEVRPDLCDLRPIDADRQKEKADAAT